MEDITKIKKRPDYLIPKTKYSKADQVFKIIRVGNGLGIHLPRDVTYAMGLEKGHILKVTLELFPSDKLKLKENDQ